MATHQTPSGVLLDLRLTAGSIEVTTTESGSTTVSLEPLGGGEAATELIEATREEAVRESDGSARVIVHVPERSGLGRLRGQPDLLMRISAPAGARMKATTASADVRCDGQLGGAAVRTASGDVTLDDVDGSVDVRTQSGEVRMGRVSADARAQTMSGDVTAGDVGGSAYAKSMSGDVALGLVAGSVEALTMSGDVHVRGVRSGSVELSSMSGDLEVGVARGTRVYLDVQTLSGEARSDLPVSDRPTGEKGPEVTLKASSKSGDVRIRRAPDPAQART
jgi:Toastrack DUF4097